VTLRIYGSKILDLVCFWRGHGAVGLGQSLMYAELDIAARLLHSPTSNALGNYCICSSAVLQCGGLTPPVRGSFYTLPCCFVYRFHRPAVGAKLKVYPGRSLLL